LVVNLEPRTQIKAKAIRPDLTPRQEHEAVERFREGESAEDLAWRFGVKTKAIEDAIRKRMPR
jgi:hypothetical protein